MTGTKRFNSLFGGITRRKKRLEHAHFLYGMVVASARDPKLFGRFEIPDTFDGRFEMLVAHLYVINDGLRRKAEEGSTLSQEVFDLFIADMDASLRELGVGDQVVPKRLAKMTRVVHGRVAAYDRARESSQSARSQIAIVVSRNVFDEREPQGSEYAMADWILECIDNFPAIALGKLPNENTLFAAEPCQQEQSGDDL